MVVKRNQRFSSNSGFRECLVSRGPHSGDDDEHGQTSDENADANSLGYDPVESPPDCDLGAHDADGADGSFRGLLHHEFWTPLGHRA